MCLDPLRFSYWEREADLGQGYQEAMEALNNRDNGFSGIKFHVRTLERMLPLVIQIGMLKSLPYFSCTWKSSFYEGC